MALKRKINPAKEHFKLLVFVLLLIELVLFLLAIIFGRLFGFKLTVMSSLWLGVIVAGCYALIVFANLAVLLVSRTYLRFKNRGKDPLITPSIGK